MDKILQILNAHHLLNGKIYGSSSVTPSRVVNDSRKVQPGCVFVAIPGQKSDGHDFLHSAAERGATLLIHSKTIDYSTLPPTSAMLKVKDPYFAYSLLCEYFHGYPARKFKLHGITGTNGKTTTAFLMQRIFNESQHPCGLISTIKYAFGNSEREAARTTPEANELQELFSEIANNGCTDAVMEFSSHGLDQHRAGVPQLETAIFTNLTRDHLDYHQNMENYFAAKKTLFTDYSAPHKIINIDDPHGQRLKDEIPDAVTFGKTIGADYQIDHIQLNAAGSLFTLNQQVVRTNLCGEHNIYNLCGALIAAVAIKIPLATAIAAADGLKIPGRLEHFKIKRAHFYIDYAHTPDALERVLNLLRKLTNKRLIVIFGCGGDRDRSKRPLMGRIAALNSDLAIVTSDNPRNEDPNVIIDEICAGIPSGHKIKVEPDRRCAIQYAKSLTESGDIVLIAGKGHETYQEIQGIKYHFDDREELLK